MLYELRVYYIYSGRLEAIHKRFADHTIGLFVKHGIRTMAFWEDAEGGFIVEKVESFFMNRVPYSPAKG